MSYTANPTYISVGGNRHSAAADWSIRSNIVAFGADQNVALWRPLNEHQSGIFALLRGHKDKVNAVRFLNSAGKVQDDDEVLVTGSADGRIRVWRSNTGSNAWKCVAEARAHDAAVNCIAILGGSNVFATGSADTTIKLWAYKADELSLLTTINTRPRFIPLTLVLGGFPNTSYTDALFLAAGGTRNDIQVHSVLNIVATPSVKLCATLTGHEGWIHSLSLQEQDKGNFLLASASHDKYVRLWKFTSGDVSFLKAPIDPADTSSQNTLTAKVQKVSIPGAKYSITFEALLLGHEDWVYTAAWNPASDLQLLTASADGSLAIWEPDPASGIWVSASRLGEISGQKGATTATGSSGGFWNGLWSPDGQAVTCLGRTGSWRLWAFDEARQFWDQRSGVGGHISSANSLSWPPDGSYLLSTSSDQTTRLHAEWKRGTKRTWHEFARPQIHGYDLNCIASNNSHQFVSGADEKLLRVFDEPKAIAGMLSRLCKIDQPDQSSLPETAAMPVLGLSNKAIDEVAEENGENDESAVDSSVLQGVDSMIQALSEPPNEDILARHTLWPEHEKLYGHGYEISEAATNGGILATACKASSIDHAVIRLYDTSSWNEIRPPLAAHTLTVTRLAWSPGTSNILLSAGRDRQWALFQPDDGKTESWKLVQTNPKAHSRMILDAAWSPISDGQFFATAGRDKTIKLWSQNSSAGKQEFVLAQTITRKSAVTAVDITGDSTGTYAYVAAGEEDGTVSVHVLDEALLVVKTVDIDASSCPSKAVNRLSWRPNNHQHVTDELTNQLAVAAADGSVRVLGIDLAALTST